MPFDHQLTNLNLPETPPLKGPLARCPAAPKPHHHHDCHHKQDHKHEYSADSPLTYPSLPFPLLFQSPSVPVQRQRSFAMTAPTIHHLLHRSGGLLPICYSLSIDSSPTFCTVIPAIWVSSSGTLWTLLLAGILLVPYSIS